MESFELLTRLAGAHGVSGREEEIRGLIRTLAEPWCDGCRTDVMGSLICHKAGPGPRVMLCAHMDTAGLVATHVQDDGFVRFGSVGRLNAAALCGQPVQFANGAMAAVAVTQDREEKPFKMSDLYLDLGAGSREEALARITPGDTARLASPTYQTSGRVVSPCLDNRAGCLVLLQVMEALAGKTVPGDLYFVFSAQEEAGMRGAGPAAYAIDPDYGLTVDATAAGDVPESAHSGSCRLGGGAAVKVMDRFVICHPEMVSVLDRLSAEHGIAAQHDIAASEHTDAGAICAVRMGVVTGGVGIPVRYLHTPAGMADWSDIRACADLLKVFLESELPGV